jgi:hypothetical protein
MKEAKNTIAYAEKANKRLAHVKHHMEGSESDIEKRVHYIENNLGDPLACALGLSSNALANAMFAWFGNHDLNAMKQWCYVAAKLDQLYFQMQEDDPDWGRGVPGLLKPLLSDNKELIDWFAHYDLAYDMKRVENHKTHDFWVYQAIVALRGDWPRLAERCERIIADPPGATKEQKYLQDHHFYLALAQGDIEKMQYVLQEIISPKAINARLDYESGFTADLISTPAVIYAKIAWRHGYKVKVDSPYIPQEWLPIEPLNQYDNHYAFLKT